MIQEEYTWARTQNLKLANWLSLNCTWGIEYNSRWEQECNRLSAIAAYCPSAMAHNGTWYLTYNWPSAIATYWPSDIARNWSSDLACTWRSDMAWNWSWYMAYHLCWNMERNLPHHFAPNGSCDLTSNWQEVIATKFPVRSVLPWTVRYCQQFPIRCGMQLKVAMNCAILSLDYRKIWNAIDGGNWVCKIARSWPSDRACNCLLELTMRYCAQFSMWSGIQLTVGMDSAILPAIDCVILTSIDCTV